MKRSLLVLAVSAATIPLSALQTPTEVPASKFKGHDAMDHWIGNWDVFVGEQRVGRNVITKTLNGYGVMEHWTNARGKEGRSFFVFEGRKSTWKQLWISDGGWIVEKEGKAIADGIQLEGTSRFPDGRVVKAREKLTKNADGSVRQMMEDYDDNAKKWVVVWDARYVRVKS